MADADALLLPAHGARGQCGVKGGAVNATSGRWVIGWHVEKVRRDWNGGESRGAEWGMEFWPWKEEMRSI